MQQYDPNRRQYYPHIGYGFYNQFQPYDYRDELLRQKESLERRINEYDMRYPAQYDQSQQQQTTDQKQQTDAKQSTSEQLVVKIVKSREEANQQALDYMNPNALFLFALEDESELYAKRLNIGTGLPDFKTYRIVTDESTRDASIPAITSSGFDMSAFMPMINMTLERIESFDVRLNEIKEMLSNVRAWETKSANVSTNDTGMGREKVPASKGNNRSGNNDGETGKPA